MKPPEAKLWYNFKHLTKNQLAWSKRSTRPIYKIWRCYYTGVGQTLTINRNAVLTINMRSLGNPVHNLTKY